MTFVYLFIGYAYAANSGREWRRVLIQRVHGYTQAFEVDTGNYDTNLSKIMFHKLPNKYCVISIPLYYFTNINVLKFSDTWISQPKLFDVPYLVSAHQTLMNQEGSQIQFTNLWINLLRNRLLRFSAIGVRSKCIIQ